MPLVPEPSHSPLIMLQTVDMQEQAIEVGERSSLANACCDTDSCLATEAMQKFNIEKVNLARILQVRTVAS